VLVVNWGSILLATLDALGDEYKTEPGLGHERKKELTKVETFLLLPDAQRKVRKTI
jgi:hypothetical protein